MANQSLTDFAGNHSFVSGLILIAIGAAGVIGAISGNLAAMIAALVDPTDLAFVSSGTESSILGGGQTPLGLQFPTINGIPYLPFPLPSGGPELNLGPLHLQT